MDLYISTDPDAKSNDIRRDEKPVSSGEVVGYICRLQEVFNTALGVDEESTFHPANDVVSVPRKTYIRFQDALKALNPKTIEQLASEQMQAADYMHKRATDGSAESYSIAARGDYQKARNAYLKAVGES